MMEGSGGSCQRGPGTVRKQTKSEEEGRSGVSEVTREARWTAMRRSVGCDRWCGPRTGTAHRSEGRRPPNGLRGGGGARGAGIYLTTALPEPPATLKVTLPEYRTLLVKAMKQEAARAELARAVITAQQKIKSLRRS
jgi:hypothetical protein